MDYDRNNHYLNSSQAEREENIKFAQIIQKHLAAMGLTPNQQQSSHWQLNFRQFFCFTKCAVDVVAIVVYIFCKAENIDEYIDSIFALTVVVAVLIAFTSIIFKNDKLFNTIEAIAEETTFSKFVCSNLFIFSKFH